MKYLKSRVGLILFLFILIPTLLNAASYIRVGTHESITPGDTATSITATIKNPTSGLFKNKSAIAALITVEDNSARFTIDGTTPTNSNGTSADTGHRIDAGQSYYIDSPMGVNQFSIIDFASGSVSIIKITVFFK